MPKKPKINKRLDKLFQDIHPEENIPQPGTSSQVRKEAAHPATSIPARQKSEPVSTPKPIVWQSTSVPQPEPVTAQQTNSPASSYAVNFQTKLQRASGHPTRSC
jgi:hypothetical protein